MNERDQFLLLRYTLVLPDLIQRSIRGMVRAFAANLVYSTSIQTSINQTVAINCFSPNS